MDDQSGTCESGTRRGVAADADVPEPDRHGQRRGGYQRGEVTEVAELVATKQSHGWIKRCEGEGNDPAQKELNVDGVN